MARALLLLIAAAIAVAYGEEITSLPGIENVPFKQYSGYITVDESNGRALFYWFVESQNDPANDPLVLWLQGGPGCSGMIGFLEENGPFVPNYDGGLDYTDQSWNRIANVLYIDAPAGVGFSYSNTSSDYFTDNNKTAHDNYVFLQNWLEEFPSFKGRDLFVSGESYAGDYGPQLVLEIIEGSDTGLRNQLKGLLLGNPVLSCPAWKEFHESLQLEMYFWHGLVPITTIMEWKSMGCDKNLTSSCLKMYGEARAAIGPLDPDNLYTNECTGNGTLDFVERNPDGSCNSLQNRVAEYLNREDVQQAIHAQPAKWVSCQSSDVLHYFNNWTNIIPYYEQFFKDMPDLRIMIYSGDVDIATVPHFYTQLCLLDLKRPVVEKWRRWTVNDLTAGFVEQYDTYTFATVKGAGHEVPLFTPYSAFYLYEHFLNNEPL